MKRFFVLILLLLATPELHAQNNAILTGLHPRPQTSFIRAGNTSFTVDKSSVILISDSAPATTMKAVAYLQKRLTQEIGDTLHIFRMSQYPLGFSSKTIALGEQHNFPQLDAAMSGLAPQGESFTKNESYSLDVSPAGLFMQGSDSSGIFYSVSTLAQLILETKGAIPSLHIFDYPDYPVRWVFSMHNLQVNKAIHDLMKIEDTMAAYKMNGLNQTDFKYSVLDIVAPWYFTDVDTLHQYSVATNTEIIPSIFGGEGILWHDPDLAEGFPTTCKYVIEGDTGRILSDPRMLLPNGDFEKVSNGQFTGWGYYDNPNVSMFVDSTTVHSGKYSARCTNFTDTTPRTRFIKGLTCDSNTSYHMSVWVKTQNFQQGYGGSFQLLAIGGAGNNSRSLTATQYDIPATSNGWMKYDVVFNTLGFTSVSVYVGVWDGTGGTIWFDDFQIEDAGLTNMLHRATTLPQVTPLHGGKRYVEGADYQQLIDKVMEQSNGSYPWHASPSFKLSTGSSIHNGDTVQVKFWRTMTVLNYQNGDGYQFPCLSEDTLYSIFHEQIRSLDALHKPHQYFLSHDEWRVLGWDSACESRHLTAGQILADNLTKCDSIIKVVHPNAQTYVWSDMFDTLHNAHNNYYLVNGDLTGDWNLIPKNITIVNWSGGFMKQSLKFFADHGFSQVTSPYYDVPNTVNMRDWRIAMEGIPNMNGMMYTTWGADYSYLKPFADYAWSAGPMIVHEPVNPNKVVWGEYVPINATVFADPYDPIDTITKVEYRQFYRLLGKADTTIYSMVADTGHVYRCTNIVQCDTASDITYDIQATDKNGITRTTPRYLILHYPGKASVQSAVAENQISVYPNPCEVDVQLRLPLSLGSCSVDMVNALGALVRSYRSNAGGSTTLDVRDLPASTYTMQIRTDHGTYEKQFVKIK